MRLPCVKSLGLYKTEVIRHRSPWRNIDECGIRHPGMGLTGSTIADYWNQLEIFHRQNLKWHIIAN